jgi:hypothetical protein
MEIDDLIREYKKIKDNTLPDQEKLDDDKMALLRSKSLHYLLSAFSSYKSEEIDIICKFLFLSSGSRSRIDLYKDEGKKVYVEMQKIIKPDKELEEKIVKIEELYAGLHDGSYPIKSFKREEINDFCHHFGYSIHSCLDVARNDSYNPYVSR